MERWLSMEKHFSSMDFHDLSMIIHDIPYFFHGFPPPSMDIVGPGCIGLSDDEAKNTEEVICPDCK